MAEIYKWYVVAWKRREKPEDLWVDYQFSHDPAAAATWDSEDRVEADRQFLSATKISVDLPDGAKHPCGEFKSEMRSANEYILYCEMPFLISEANSFIRELK